VVTTGLGVSTPAADASYVYLGLGSYVPLTPFRIVDTRSGRGGIHTYPALGSGQTLALQITGYTDARTSGSVPANATAVVLNVLAVNGSSSSLNTSDSQREVNLYNALGTVNVVVDVEGYFVPQASSNPAGEFHAIAPLRVCDTRAKQPADGCNLGHRTSSKIGSGHVLKVNVSGIPSGVGILVRPRE